MPVSNEGKFQERVDAFCRQLLQEAMEQSGGNRARAARALGLSYHKLSAAEPQPTRREGGCMNGSAASRVA